MTQSMFHATQYKRNIYFDESRITSREIELRLNKTFSLSGYLRALIDSSKFCFSSMFFASKVFSVFVRNHYMEIKPFYIFPKYTSLNFDTLSCILREITAK